MSLSKRGNRKSRCVRRLCLSHVTRCLLTDDCNCDMRETACKETCVECLTRDDNMKVLSKCCSCVDLCNDRRVEKKYVVLKEKLAAPEQALFGLLVSLLDKRQLTNGFTVYPELASSKEPEPEPAKRSQDSCSYIFVNKCLPQNQCSEECLKFGASHMRWFAEVGGCCQCMSPNCPVPSDGIDEPKCKECNGSQLRARSAPVLDKSKPKAITKSTEKPTKIKVRQAKQLNEARRRPNGRDPPPDKAPNSVSIGSFAQDQKQQRKYAPLMSDDSNQGQAGQTSSVRPATATRLLTDSSQSSSSSPPLTSLTDNSTSSAADLRTHDQSVIVTSSPAVTLPLTSSTSTAKLTATKSLVSLSTTSSATTALSPTTSSSASSTSFISTTTDTRASLHAALSASSSSAEPPRTSAATVKEFLSQITSLNTDHIVTPTTAFDSSQISVATAAAAAKQSSQANDPGGNNGGGSNTSLTVNNSSTNVSNISVRETSSNLNLASAAAAIDTSSNTVFKFDDAISASSLSSHRLISSSSAISNPLLKSSHVSSSPADVAHSPGVTSDPRSSLSKVTPATAQSIDANHFLGDDPNAMNSVARQQKTSRPVISLNAIASQRLDDSSHVVAASVNEPLRDAMENIKSEEEVIDTARMSSTFSHNYNSKSDNSDDSLLRPLSSTHNSRNYHRLRHSSDPRDDEDVVIEKVKDEMDSDERTD